MSSRYSDDDKARALELYRTEGLAAAAASVGASKSTVKRWATAAGLTAEDQAELAERSAAKTDAATAASIAARRAEATASRQALSDLLITQLGPKAAALLVARLDEEESYRQRLLAEEERLEVALAGLDVVAELGRELDLEEARPGAAPDPVRRKLIDKARRSARAEVSDAGARLKALRSARISVRELVGTMSRSVTDHLALEGELDAAAISAAGFTAVFTGARPDRMAVEVVDLGDPGQAAKARPAARTRPR